MLKGLTIDCSCGRSLEVDGLPDTLMNEDYSPVIVVCKKCKIKHEVILHMNILGKELTVNAR